MYLIERHGGRIEVHFFSNPGQPIFRGSRRLAAASPAIAGARKIAYDLAIWRTFHLIEPGRLKSRR